MTRVPMLLAAVLMYVLLAGARAVADDPRKAPTDDLAILARVSPESLARWGDAQQVFTASLDKVIPGPTGLSEPPLYTDRLEMTVDQVFRGTLEAGKKLTGSHSARQKLRPTFPEGHSCLVAAKSSRGGLVVTRIEKAEPELVAAARLVCRLPLGWKVEGAQLVSPWAALGPKAWPAEAKVIGGLACSKTGRPALLAGDGVKLEVAPVPPEKEIQWTNPDGDGLYKVTVTNTTDSPLKVPALLSDGHHILWDDSLVILCQGKVYPIPGAQGVKSKPRPTVLQPGQAVSTTVNALALEGPEWPRGGYRIEFQFCLGEKSNVQSFYYLSRHHDKLRQKAQAP